MRVLIVSYCFPPFDTIGGVRIGKTAKYLYHLGNDIRVVSAKDQTLGASLNLEIPREKVIYTRRRIITTTVRRPRSKGNKSDASQSSSASSRKNASKRFVSLLKPFVQFRGAQIEWFPFAYWSSCNLIKRWKPDLLFASAMPFTSLVIGYALSRRFRIPWVAELRDLWVDNHYYNYNPWRKRCMSYIERLVLTSASALITVSEPLAQTLRKKYHRPTFVILNAFDANDYRIGGAQMERKTLNICYTGRIWEGKRDPSPLFSAIRDLGNIGKRVRVLFFGDYLESIHSLASEYGVEKQVEVRGRVPYRDSLMAQKASDILLLLLWTDSREKGVYTGKLFEYIGSHRPILAIGCNDNVASDLIVKRKAGFVSNEPRKIRDQLLQWLELKQRSGKIPDLPVETSAGLDRQFQTEQLERIFQRIVNHGPLSSSASTLRHGS